METYIIFSVVLGVLYIPTALGTLRCIECDHISWNQTYSFTGAQSVYQILQSKYNPACAQENPNDRNLFQQNQQQQSGQFINNRYEIGETICPSFTSTNRCNYLFGDATVYLPSYDATMRLNMHVRNCEDVSPDVQDWCYERDTYVGYNDVKNFIQDRLSFLGNVEVRHFRGQQCYCSYNLCYPYVSSSRNVVASTTSLVLALLWWALLR